MLRESRKFCAASASQAHPSFLLRNASPRLAHRSFLPGHRTSEFDHPGFQPGLRSFPLGGPSSEQGHPSFLLAQPSSEQGGESLRGRLPRFRLVRPSFFHRARREHQRRSSFRQYCRMILQGETVDRPATLSPDKQSLRASPVAEPGTGFERRALPFKLGKTISEKMVPHAVVPPALLEFPCRCRFRRPNAF